MGEIDPRDPDDPLRSLSAIGSQAFHADFSPDPVEGDPDRPVVVRPRLLIVDDDEGVSRNLCRALVHREFDVQAVNSADQALEILAQGKVEVMLLDIVMPQVSGMELLQTVKQRHPDVEVIMMTGHGDIDTAVRALKQGAYDFLTKPFVSIDSLVASIDKASQHKRLLDR